MFLFKDVIGCFTIPQVSNISSISWPFEITNTNKTRLRVKRLHRNGSMNWNLDCLMTNYDIYWLGSDMSMCNWPGTTTLSNPFLIGCLLRARSATFSIHELCTSCLFESHAHLADEPFREGISHWGETGSYIHASGISWWSKTYKWIQRIGNWIIW